MRFDISDMRAMWSVDALQLQRALMKHELWVKAICVYRICEVGPKTWMQTKIKSVVAEQGDVNTNFFQGMADFHRRNNTIDRLLVNGETTEDPGIIKGELILLYAETGNCRPNCNFRECPRIVEHN